MMQWHTIIKWTFFIISIGGIILATRFFVEKEITRTYEAIVSNNEITSAFLDNRTETLRDVSQKYRLQYQHIQDGKIIFATEQDLPTPQVIPIRTVIVAGVLPESPSTLLKTLNPYRVLRRDGLYIAAPIFPDGLDSSGYIVYAKLLP